MQWTMSSVKGVVHDHTKPIMEMSGKELILELLYLSSGSADELDQRKQVKMGPSLELVARRQEIGDYLASLVKPKIPETA